MSTKFLQMDSFIHYQVQFTENTNRIIKMAEQTELDNELDMVLANLADQYYELDRSIKALKNRQEKLKAEMITQFNKAGINQAKGLTAELTVTPIERYDYKAQLWSLLKPKTIALFSPEPKITETGLKEALLKGLIDSDELELIQAHKELKEISYRINTKPLTGGAI